MSQTVKAHFWISLITSILLFLQGGLGIYSYFSTSHMKDNMSRPSGMMQQYGNNNSNNSSSSSSTSSSNSTNSSGEMSGGYGNRQMAGMGAGGVQRYNNSFSLMRIESSIIGLIINIVFLLLSIIGFVLSWKISRNSKVQIES